MANASKFLDEIEKLKKKKKEQGEDTTSLEPVAPTKIDTSKTVNSKEVDSFFNALNTEREKLRQRETITDIAPVKSTVGTVSAGGRHGGGGGSFTVKSEEDESLLDFFQKGAFDDGYQIGDVTKSILGTAGDLGVGVVKGVMKMGEGLLDAGDYGIAAIEEALGAKERAEKRRQRAAQNGVDDLFAPVDDYLDKYSVFGRTMDAGAEALGQIGAILLTGGLAAGAGAGAAGATAATTGVMGLSSFGSATGEAYKGGAETGEAELYGAIAGTADAVSELIFGGLGKAVGAVGLSKGLSSADDILAKKVTEKITNTIAKNAVQLGIKAGAEGTEEVLAGLAQAAGKKLTYMSEEEIGQIIADENLLEQFVVGAMASGVSQVPSVNQANKTGTDYITGRTKNEQAVIDRVVEQRVKDAESDGTKLKPKQRQEIEEQAASDMERGRIDIETIEEVLGGDDYRTYQTVIKNEDALRREYEELGALKEPTLAEKTRYEELHAKKAEIFSDERRTALKSKVSERVSEMAKSDRLSESFAERARRGEYFTEDVTKYKSDAAKKTVQNLVESKLANNTGRTHDMAETVAKIAEDKGIIFNFTNNQKLRESGKTAGVAENAIINGYKDAEGITVNLDSPKAWQFIVGHEVAHTLEGTTEYTALSSAVKDYLVTKGEYDGRKAAVAAIYSEGTDIDSEISADVVGELFTDEQFVSELSTKHRNVFQKVFDEIKHLVKMVTAGSKEARQLEQVKRTFERAYRAAQETQAQAVAQNDAEFYDSGAAADDRVQYSLRVTDTETLDFLDSQETITTYKTMQIVDGKLYPPMAARIEGQHEDHSILGEWEQATEHPELIKNGNKFKLDKGKGNGSIEAAYNPYMHSSNLVLNDQFSAAYNRDNLVTVECVVPVSEATSGYHAEFAKDSVGWHPWHTGTVAGQVRQQTGKERQVFLSRWIKPVRIVPDSEVAAMYKDLLDGTDIAVPDNVVTPSLLVELKKAGIKIKESGKVQHSVSSEAEVQQTNETLQDVGVQYDAESETVSYSLSSLEDMFHYNQGEAEYIAAREEYVTALAKATGKTTTEANRYLDSLFLVHDMIAKDRDRLDYEAAVDRSARVSNAEYGGSIDFSTLCAKRRLFTGTFDAIQQKLPDTVLNENDFLRIRNLLLEKGQESPCSMCYVEGSRAKHGVYVKKFLDDYLKTDPEWKPQIADFTSTTRLEQTRIQHPEAYKAYTQAMNALSQRKPKEASVRTDYKGEILEAFKNDTTVAEKNKNGGVRFNSFSDFEIIHALDAMQVLTDMARVGLNGQAYTKVKEFAEAFGNTGLKINLSLVAKGVDADGKLIMDETNGMNYAEALDIRSRYSENVGTVIVVFNDAQLKAALADSTIDYVLPFHRSQWKKSQYTMMGLPAETRDYTNIQNDRYKNPTTGRAKKAPDGNIMPNAYWRFNLSGRENAQIYLDYINEHGYIPKFDHVLNKVDGKWVLPDGAVGDGYYKLLIDFKMYDNDGRGSPQKPVLPEFNMPYIRRMLDDYVGGHQAFPVAHDVVDAFVAEKQHSLSVEDAHPVKRGTAARELLYQGAEMQDAAPMRQAADQFVDVGNMVAADEVEGTGDMFPGDLAPMSEDDGADYDRLMSFNDEDAPPEMDAPYYGDEGKQTQPDDPFDGRDIKEVGKRGVKAYMFENAEVKSFFQREANVLLGELERTVKGERFMSAEGEWTGTSRHTTDDIAYLLDELKYSYADIRRGLEAIMEGQGAENTAVAKRIEFIINDRLSKGYTDAFSGAEIPADQAYLNVLREKQITEYNDAAFDALMADADAFVPPITEDIAPVAESGRVREAAFAVDAPIFEDADDADGGETIAAEIPAEEDTQTDDGHIRTVRERLEAKLGNFQTELENNRRLRTEAASEYDRQIAELETAYEGLPNKATKKANAMQRRIERLTRFKGNVDADYAKRIFDLEERVAKVSDELRTGESTTEQANMRRDLHASIVENIRNTFEVNGYDMDEVFKGAKNLSTFSTADNTPQRVMQKSLGYKQGQILADLTVNRVAQHETDGIRWLNRYTDRKNGVLAQISKQYNIKPGSKESAAAQMYAEGFFVNKYDEIIKYGDAELAADFPDAKTQANIKGLARDGRIRAIYDATLEAINESRVRNAYPAIQKLDNYFLHFRAMEDTFSRMGLPFNPEQIKVFDLPTDLNGVTADLKPGQPYFASAKHRLGKRTSFDLLGGLEKYLSSAKNQIYHIDDIQTLRALRNHIADTYGQSKGLESLDSMTEEEAQARIKEVYGSHMSTFASFLNDEANHIAGKKDMVDRALESRVGRRAMAFMDVLNRQVGANMVGYNLSSALTNLIAPVQAFAKMNKFAFVKGFAQTAANRIGGIVGRGDTFAEESSVMVRREGEQRFHRTAWQKMSDPGYALMGAVDSISTEIIARAKFNELTGKGMTSEQAHFETDKWVSALMGDRSLGQQPLLYNSKMLGIITKFQLEVRNQLDAQFYDTVKEAEVATENIENAAKRNAVKAAKITSTFVQLAVAQHIFGKVFESIAGYNPAFDIIEAISKAAGWDDDEDDDDTVLDNIGQGFLSLVEDMPYSSVLTGGRVPIEAALPVNQIISGKDSYGNEINRWKVAAEAVPYYVLPGGYGQIKKTVAGLSMYSDDHPVAGSYTDSGNLRFPVGTEPLDVAQAALFGQWSSSNARDYFDDERKPLSEKQTAEYAAADMTIQEYWAYRDGLKEQGNLAAQAEYINSLDIPTWKKNLFINNLTDRKEAIDMTNYGQYGSLSEMDFAKNSPEKYALLKEQGVTYAQYETFDDKKKDAYGWAAKNPEKYSFIRDIGYTIDDYASATDEQKDAWTWAYSNPEKYMVSRAVSDDLFTYRSYTAALNDIKADKDAEGKSISGSRKDKVVDWLNGLDADYGQKIILLKSEYPSEDSYNNDIIDYLNDRDDITGEEMVVILTELGFKVASDGTITWD